MSLTPEPTQSMSMLGMTLQAARDHTKGPLGLSLGSVTPLPSHLIFKVNTIPPNNVFQKIPIWNRRPGKKGAYFQSTEKAMRNPTPFCAIMPLCG
jgi:hypothetical protein